MKHDRLLLELDIPGYDTLYKPIQFYIDSNLNYYVLKGKLESIR